MEKKAIIVIKWRKELLTKYEISNGKQVLGDGKEMHIIIIGYKNYELTSSCRQFTHFLNDQLKSILSEGT